MSDMTWLADALRAEGCKVKEEGNWKARGRDGSFDPQGPCWHHTGTTTSSSNPHPTLNTCINGRSDLPGPLCHVLIGYDGVCHVIAAGRANHAGNHSGWGPYTSSKDGNAQMVGFEIDYDGTQKMSAAQKDAATRCSAAVLKKFGHNYEWATRHEETSTTGKWDTGGLSGSAIRELVKDYMSNPSSGEGIFGMTEVVKFSNGKAQEFTGNGTFKTLVIDDDDTMSLLTGPVNPYSAVVGIRFEATGKSNTAKTGDVVQACLQAVIDYEGDKPTVVESQYPIHEVTMTAGSSFINIAWLNTIGGNEGNGKRRLRAFILAPTDKSIRVTKVTARVLR